MTSRYCTIFPWPRKSLTSVQASSNSSIVITSWIIFSGVGPLILCWKKSQWYSNKTFYRALYIHYHVLTGIDITKVTTHKNNDNKRSNISQVTAWTIKTIPAANHSQFSLLSNSLKAAYSFHTLFLELVIMIKYRFSIGEWNIYYCHVVPIGRRRYIFTCYFHSLPRICWSKVWHNEKKPWHFRGNLLGSTIWQSLFRSL